MAETTTHTYYVHGMACDHCATSVTEEVSELAGVDRVDVDLRSSQLTITGNTIADAAVRGAVEKAGYELATDR